MCVGGPLLLLKVAARVLGTHLSSLPKRERAQKPGTQRAGALSLSAVPPSQPRVVYAHATMAISTHGFKKRWPYAGRDRRWRQPLN